MKSKPPTKKLKIEVPSSSPQSTEGQGKPKAKILNAAIKEGTSSKAAAAAASELLASTSKMKAPAGSASNAAPGTSSSSPPLRLSFPILPAPELSKEFPRIFNMAQHAKIDGGYVQPISLPIDEVELIQHELETLWSLIAVRTRVLKNENDILESLIAGNADMSSTTVATLLGEHYDPHHQEKINTVKSIIDSGHGTRTSVTAAAKLVMGMEQSKSVTSTASTSSIVVGSNRKSNNSASAATSVPIPGPSPSARQPKKKLKAELGDKSKVGGNKPARAGQNRSHSVSMDDSFLRHEAPNQFWEFADSYCRDITQEDIDELDKEITEFRDIPDSAFSVPPLGKHYSGLDKKKTGDVNGSPSIKAKEEKDKDAVGPLTQRLVTALVEDRISQYTVQTSNGTREELNGGGGESHLIPRPGLVKALGLDAAGPGAQVPLESRLKLVLAEQGYLLADEAEDPFSLDQNDEVLAEIRRTFNTLRKLHTHNLDKLEKLSMSAKGELSRLPQKKDLEKADKDIIAAYRGMTACRIKRKPITQKERSMATKALQYRQHALEKLTGTNNPTLTEL